MTDKEKQIQELLETSKKSMHYTDSKKVTDDDILELCKRLEAITESRNDWQKKAMNEKSNHQYWKGKFEAAEKEKVKHMQSTDFFRIGLNKSHENWKKAEDKIKQLTKRAEAAEKKMNGYIQEQAAKDARRDEYFNKLNKKNVRLEAKIAGLEGT